MAADVGTGLRCSCGRCPGCSVVLRVGRAVDHAERTVGIGIVVEVDLAAGRVGATGSGHIVRPAVGMAGAADLARNARAEGLADRIEHNGDAEAGLDVVDVLGV